MDDYTTIRIKRKNADKLFNLQNRGESYDDVLDRILSNSDGFNTLDILKKKMREDNEAKLAQIYRDKINEYNSKHSADYEANRKALGIDTPVGKTVPMGLSFDELKKKTRR